MAAGPYCTPGSRPAGAEAWVANGAGVLRLAGPQAGPPPDAIRDSGNTLLPWMRRRKATAVVVRPDGFVYAAADTGQQLPPPPVGVLVPNRTEAVA